MDTIDQGRGWIPREDPDTVRGHMDQNKYTTGITTVSRSYETPDGTAI